MTVIIFEGTDRTGKSTYVNKLQQLAGGVILNDNINAHVNNAVNISQLPIQLATAHGDMIYLNIIRYRPYDFYILDRSGAISDMIYSQYYDRKSYFKQHTFEQTYLELPTQVLLVLCDISDKELEYRYAVTPDELVSLEDAKQIRDLYRVYFDKSKLDKLKINVEEHMQKNIDKIVRRIDWNEAKCRL